MHIYTLYIHVRPHDTFNTQPASYQFRRGPCDACAADHVINSSRPSASVFSSPAFNYYAQCARRGGGRRPGNEANFYCVLRCACGGRPENANEAISEHNEYFPGGGPGAMTRPTISTRCWKRLPMLYATAFLALLPCRSYLQSRRTNPLIYTATVSTMSPRLILLHAHRITTNMLPLYN